MGFVGLREDEIGPCKYQFVEEIFLFPLIFPTLQPEDIKQIKISLIRDCPPIWSHSLPPQPEQIIDLAS